MENIAVYTPSVTIYWSSIVITLGVIAFFALGYALFTSHHGSAFAMLFFIPLCTVLSLLLSRGIHWYCHQEQYSSLRAALTDYSSGSYCVPGLVLGMVLAVLLIRVLHLTKNAYRMLDCLAPATVLWLAILRMSSLFNSACRGKNVITDPAYQRFPFAATVQTSGGTYEYRFATFFAEAFLLFILTVFLLNFFYHRRRRKMGGGCRRDGNVFLMFLAWFSSVEIVTDSTRYDSSFLPINGFVSLVQILAIVALVFVLVYYSVYSVRANGMKWYHWAMWICFLLMASAAGISEYLIQRHGNWYLSCYSLMSFACLMLSIVDYWMYLTVCSKSRNAEQRSDRK